MKIKYDHFLSYNQTLRQSRQEDFAIFFVIIYYRVRSSSIVRIFLWVTQIKDKIDM